MAITIYRDGEPNPIDWANYHFASPDEDPLPLEQVVRTGFREHTSACSDWFTSIDKIDCFAADVFRFLFKCFLAVSLLGIPLLLQWNETSEINEINQGTYDLERRILEVSKEDWIKRVQVVDELPLSLASSVSQFNFSQERYGYFNPDHSCYKTAVAVKGLINEETPFFAFKVSAKKAYNFSCRLGVEKKVEEGETLILQFSQNRKVRTTDPAIWSLSYLHHAKEDRSFYYIYNLNLQADEQEDIEKIQAILNGTDPDFQLLQPLTSRIKSARSGNPDA